jgi:hypothetical protein
MGEHDVTALTAADLERAWRELTASLALARPGSPALVPIKARDHAGHDDWPIATGSSKEPTSRRHAFTDDKARSSSAGRPQ